jgi:hypothetical protein
MTIEDLEIALLYFNENRDSYISLHHIHELLNQTSPTTKIEALLVLEKLVRDRYIIEELQEGTSVKRKVEMPIKQYGYFITFDGIILLDTLPGEFKNRPYHYLQAIERKKKQREAAENWPKRHWMAADTIKNLTAAIIGGFIGSLISLQCNHAKAQATTKVDHVQDVTRKASPFQ